MKKITGFMLVFFISFNLFNSYPSAHNLNEDDLENVTISLLHQTVVKALKAHYGGITQFEELELVKIHSRQLPADLKDDSSFKSPASVYDITLQLNAILGDRKKETVTIVLSNEFSSSGYDVVTFDAK
jgi:hypothetical protein